MTAPRVLFYVQHLLGIGHLARASRIADALITDGFDLTLVTGGAPVAGFPSAGIKTEILPTILADNQGFTGLVNAEGYPIDEEFKSRRCDHLLQLLTKLRPDIVIIEAFPFGRRQMRFELIPLLEAIEAASPRPLLVSSVRDIVQERTKAGRNEETADLIERFFDLVMVHGDPSFAPLEDTFPLTDRISAKIAYTGLVAGPLPPPAQSIDHFDVVVSAGGGAAGRNLVETAIAASIIIDRPMKWLIITGPNLPKDEYEAAVAAAPPDVAVARFRTDFGALLAAAELSISQAGYNTVGDLLRAGCRALLIPFAAGGETEQTQRATRLAALGYASVLEESDLTPAALAAAIEAALARAKPHGEAPDLDGARGSARVLRRLLTSSSDASPQP